MHIVPAVCIELDVCFGFNDYFSVMLARCNARLVCIGREENGKMPCRHHKLCRSLVGIKLHILALIVLLR